MLRPGYMCPQPHSRSTNSLWLLRGLVAVLALQAHHQLNILCLGGGGGDALINNFLPGPLLGFALLVKWGSQLGAPEHREQRRWTGECGLTLKSNVPGLSAFSMGGS